MKAPFIGTRILENIPVNDIIDLVDREVLFGARWQFRKGQTTEEWKKLKDEKIVPIFERMIYQCEARDYFEPKAIYGHFECRKQENALLVTVPSPLLEEGQGDGPARLACEPQARVAGGGRVIGFEFPRQKQEPHLCVSDFFEHGFITLQLVTVGNRVIEEGAKLFNEKKYSDTFFLRGLAAELAEALAEYLHRHILKELEVPLGQGVRLSFGYPVAPNLSDQKKLFAILDGKKIGVKLTETYQMVPEYSTSAIVSISPEAKLFRP